MSRRATYRIENTKSDFRIDISIFASDIEKILKEKGETESAKEVF
jgi:hypothetical protein